MPSLTNMDAQRIIDEQISAHDSEDAIRALKTRRNKLSSISKLPNELMSSIFIEYRTLCHPFPSLIMRNMWLNVCGVCRHWRGIALNTPQLWRFIKPYQGDLALDMLKRSKSLPLDINAFYPQYKHEVFWSVARASMLEIARIERIAMLRHDSASLVEFLELNTKSSAPSLRVLNIGLMDPPRDSPILPKGVFWLDMPALCVLFLRYTVPPELPFLPCLTQFTFFGHDLPASWFIRSLPNTPRLEALDISGVVSDALIDSLTSSQVPLHHLSRLRISAQDLGVSRIFNCLDYPGSAYIDFICGSRKIVDQLQYLVGLEAAVSRFTISEEAALICEVEINTHSDFDVLVKSSDTTLFKLSLTCMSQAIPSYAQLCSSFPLVTVPLFSLFALEYPEVVQPVIQIFPCFEQLQTIRFNRCSMEVLAGLLKADDAAKPPCPELKTILVDHCAFQRRSGKPDVEMGDTVIRIVKDRGQHGIPIRQLDIKRCAISEEMVHQFEEYVNVEWDKYCEQVKWLGLRCYDNDDDDDDDDGDGDDGAGLVFYWI